MGNKKRKKDSNATKLQMMPEKSTYAFSLKNGFSYCGLTEGSELMDSFCLMGAIFFLLKNLINEINVSIYLVNSHFLADGENIIFFD